MPELTKQESFRGDQNTTSQAGLDFRVMIQMGRVQKEVRDDSRADGPADGRYECFAVAAPGLSPLVAQELRILSLAPDVVEPDGVGFRASPSELLTANLWLRTASRVLVRAGNFPAKAFYELERRAARIAWERFLRPESRVVVRVTCRKSRLYHSGAVAERIERVIAQRTGATASAPDAADPGAQLVVVRLQRDHCTISLDASGDHLHRRGYRQATAKAPMRETLAAALLMVSGWDRRSPLIDPMCGSGTLAIEAATMALGRPPGLLRLFICEQWPEGSAVDYARIRRDAARQAEDAERLISEPLNIYASDRDAGAIAATRSNAERAGVAVALHTAIHALSAIAPPEGERGWLVTNPPYGVRVSERGALRNLYAQFGAVVKEKCAGWTVALLAADRRLVGHTGLSLTPQIRTTNGGIPVEGWVGRV